MRVGLVIDDLHGPAWIDAIVRTVAARSDAELVSVWVTGATDRRASRSVGGMLLRLYTWVDRRIFGRADDPGRSVDLSPAVAGIPRVSDDGGAGPAIDVRLRLGGSTASTGTAIPRYGDWAVEHGYGLSPGLRPERLGLAPGGPELLSGRSFTISQLVATVATDDRRAIGQVASGVDRLSLRRGSRRHLLKLPGLVARTLQAVRLDAALPVAVDEPPATHDRRRTLGAAAIALALVRIVTSFVGRRILRLLAPERWVIAVSREPAPTGEDGPTDYGAFGRLQAPDGMEWADPFPVAIPGQDLLFIEEYVREAHRGRLAVVELDDSARGWLTVKTVLERPSHLSYPFVFQWEGAWYLMPEQAATGSLELYRADAFPEHWAWHSTLLPGVPAADATLAMIDGRWWLFAAIAVGTGTAADELHLFHAETPLGPWIAHERNPVVSDVRTARPAGRLFQRDGRWYRPAQDGAVSYGHSIAILRIERIDLHGYHERIVRTIRPTWQPGLLATHTLNADGHLTAIDAMVRERRLWRPRLPPGSP